MTHRCRRNRPRLAKHTSSWRSDTPKLRMRLRKASRGCGSIVQRNLLLGSPQLSVIDRAEKFSKGWRFFDWPDVGERWAKRVQVRFRSIADSGGKVRWP